MTLSNTAGCRQDRFVALQLAYHSLVPNPLIAYGGTGHETATGCAVHTCNLVSQASLSPHPRVARGWPARLPATNISPL